MFYSYLIKYRGVLAFTTNLGWTLAQRALLLNWANYEVEFKAHMAVTTCLLPQLSGGPAVSEVKSITKHHA